MNAPWSDGEPIAATPPGVMGWLRASLRGIGLVFALGGLLVVLLILRGVERPFSGPRRPLSGAVPKWASRTALWLLGIAHRTTGSQMPHTGAVVANHAGWLDIFVLNAPKQVFFVSKAEVARWPVIGFMARAAGTVFINRDRREAGAHVALFEHRLRAGHKLLFFPEGTSTDSRRVLPFKTTLFAAFYGPELHDLMYIQPVSVIYHAPQGEDPRFYGWWGDMGFGSHLIKVLAAPRQGQVELIYHPPVRVADFPNRKALAAYCEDQIRNGHNQATAP